MTAAHACNHPFAPLTATARAAVPDDRGRGRWRPPCLSSMFSVGREHLSPRYVASTEPVVFCVQLYQMIEGAIDRGAKKIRVHALSDGRDVQDGSSVKFFGELKEFLDKMGSEKGADACIASGGGRMAVTMDRYEVCGAPLVFSVHGLVGVPK